MMKNNLLLCLLFMGIFSFCSAQDKKNPSEEVGLTRKAVMITNAGTVDKEQVFEGKYLQNETDMAYRSQAKERAMCDFARKYHTSVIVEPYVTVKKKKGYFMVKVMGYPMKGMAPSKGKDHRGGTTIDSRDMPQDRKILQENRH